MCCALTDGVHSLSPIPHADSVVLEDHDEIQNAILLLTVLLESTGILIALWCNAVVSGLNVASLDAFHSDWLKLLRWLGSRSNYLWGPWLPSCLSFSYWGDFEARNPLCGPCVLLVFHLLRSVDLVFCPACFSFHLVTLMILRPGTSSVDLVSCLFFIQLLRYSIARNHLYRPCLLSCVFLI